MREIISFSDEPDSCIKSFKSLSTKSFIPSSNCFAALVTPSKPSLIVLLLLAKVSLPCLILLSPEVKSADPLLNACIYVRK